MKLLKRPMTLLALGVSLASGASLWVQGEADASPGAVTQATTYASPSRSSSIALTSDDRYLVTVNRGKNSITIFEVRDANGNYVQHWLAEVPVGKEPRYVAISPDNRWAMVSNAVDGTVSVIDIHTYQPLIGAIPVGTEPRGIAITPNGAYAFIANHTSHNVSVISTQNWQVVYNVPTGGNPIAVAITNNGDAEDTDERVYVTRFFGELIDPAKRPDGFDDAKQGVIDTFNVGEAIGGQATVNKVTLPPLKDSGFVGDRRPYCLNTRKILQDNGEVVFFNSGADGKGDGAAALSNQVFCPDPNSQDASAEGPIANTPQGVYPNQLFAALIRGNRLYVPNVGAAPEPPLQFKVNVQGLVGVVDVQKAGYGQYDHTVNLNAQVAQETDPADPFASLDKLFLNDLVAVDANRQGNQFYFVSRGGNYVLRANLDAAGKLNIGAPGAVTRFQTGNMPTGVVVNSSATRLYTVNEINFSVTAVDLQANKVIALDIPSSEPPKAGTEEHRNLAGKLAFFTALGIPDVLDTDGDGKFDIEIRDIVPLKFRGKASNNAWSGCGSCHDDGRTDNVTWGFETGARQTIDLATTFAKNDPTDQRLLNWNAVRDANLQFNNNSIAIQGGIGFATDVNGVDRSAEIFNHGPTQGISDALDAQTEWVAKAVRGLNMPDVANAGRDLFAQNCVSCHGGVKWTKSQAGEPLYQNNPTFEVNPLGAQFFDGVPPIDPGVTVAGPQIVSVTRDKLVLKFLEDVGAFNAQSPLNIRSGAAIAGQSTQGFPELNAHHAPYFHDGSAPTLKQVFAVHTLGANTIAQSLDANSQQELEKYLNGIDDGTAPIEESDTDKFLEQIGKK
jgi:YVTN family beta-propeller protein